MAKMLRGNQPSATQTKKPGAPAKVGCARLYSQQLCRRGDNAADQVVNHLELIK